MLIEFCRPACCSPLAVKEDVAGGHVNCPKCQKLILIPSTSIFPKKESGSPFAPGATYEIEAVKRAISVSVEPYRRELEAKSTLLNEAVEMVKLRNQRIKEVESILLKVQKDLWQLEVEHEERSADYVEAQKDRSLLKKKLQEVQEKPPEAGSQVRSDEMAQELQVLKQKNRTTTERLRRTVASLAKTNLHLKQTSKLEQEQEEYLTALQSLLPEVVGAAEKIRTEAAPVQETAAFLRKASKALNDSALEVKRLRQQIKTMEQSHHHSKTELRNELKIKLSEALEKIVELESRG